MYTQLILNWASHAEVSAGGLHVLVWASVAGILAMLGVFILNGYMRTYVRERIGAVEGIFTFFAIFVAILSVVAFFTPAVLL